MAVRHSVISSFLIFASVVLVIDGLHKEDWNLSSNWTFEMQCPQIIEIYCVKNNLKSEKLQWKADGNLFAEYTYNGNDTKFPIKLDSSIEEFEVTIINFSVDNWPDTYSINSSLTAESDIILKYETIECDNGNTKGSVEVNFNFVDIYLQVNDTVEGEVCPAGLNFSSIAMNVESIVWYLGENKLVNYTVNIESLQPLDLCKTQERNQYLDDLCDNGGNLTINKITRNGSRYNVVSTLILTGTFIFDRHYLYVKSGSNNITKTVNTNFTLTCGPKYISITSNITDDNSDSCDDIIAEFACAGTDVPYFIWVYNETSILLANYTYSHSSPFPVFLNSTVLNLNISISANTSNCLDKHFNFKSKFTAQMSNFKRMKIKSIGCATDDLQNSSKLIICNKTYHWWRKLSFLDVFPLCHVAENEKLKENNVCFGVLGGAAVGLLLLAVIGGLIVFLCCYHRCCRKKSQYMNLESGDNDSSQTSESNSASSNGVSYGSMDHSPKMHETVKTNGVKKKEKSSAQISHEDGSKASNKQKESSSKSSSEGSKNGGSYSSVDHSPKKHETEKTNEVKKKEKSSAEASHDDESKGLNKQKESSSKSSSEGNKHGDSPSSVDHSPKKHEREKTNEVKKKEKSSAEVPHDDENKALNKQEESLSKSSSEGNKNGDSPSSVDHSPKKHETEKTNGVKRKEKPSAEASHDDGNKALNEQKESSSKSSSGGNENVVIVENVPTMDDQGSESTPDEMISSPITSVQMSNSLQTLPISPKTSHSQVQVVSPKLDSPSSASPPPRTSSPDPGRTAREKERVDAEESEREKEHELSKKCFPHFGHFDERSNLGSRLQKFWYLRTSKDQRTRAMQFTVKVSRQCPITLEEKDVALLKEFFACTKHPRLLTIFDVVCQEDYISILQDFVDLGSIRDLLFDVKPILDWENKYERECKHCFTPEQVAICSRDVVEAVLMLYDLGFSSIGQIHCGNVFSKDGRYFLGGFENVLLGYRTSVYSQIVKNGLLNVIDVIMFGRMIYEIATGVLLSDEQVLLDESHFTKVKDSNVREFLEFIFSDEVLKKKDPMRKIFSHPFIECVKITEQNVEIKLTPAVKALLSRVFQKKTEKKAIKDLDFTDIAKHLKSKYSEIEQCKTLGWRQHKLWAKAKSKTYGYGLITAIKIPYTCPVFVEAGLNEIKSILSRNEDFQVSIWDVDHLKIGEDHILIIFQEKFENGSLKDRVHKTSPWKQWDDKYKQQGHPLSENEIAKFGNQILSISHALGLIDGGTSPFKLQFLHTGNIFRKGDGIAVGGLENLLLGCRPRCYMRFGGYMDCIDTLMFGHLIYELASGRELEAVKPTDDDYKYIPHKNVERELKTIFENPTMSLEEILHLKLFSNHTISLDIMIPSTTEMMLLEHVRKGKRRDQDDRLEQAKYKMRRRVPKLGFSTK